ncbi:MAG: hypothetical protein IJ504_01185 [Bacteroidales bacterium]|nr:hypothetical protein [Bacteroidales bacterium]
MEVTIKQKKYKINRLIILEFIRQKKGLTLRALAENAGYASQQMYVWYRNDDIYIEQLYNIASANNMKIEISLQKRISNFNTFYGDVTIDDVMYRIEDKKINPHPNIAKFTPEVLERLKAGGKLKFLAEFMLRTRENSTQFCRKTRLNATSFKMWMKEDNIKISRIYKIAEAYDAKIIWKLIRDNNEELTYSPD